MKITQICICFYYGVILFCACTSRWVSTKQKQTDSIISAKHLQYSKSFRCKFTFKSIIIMMVCCCKKYSLSIPLPPQSLSSIIVHLFCLHFCSHTQYQFVWLHAHAHAHTINAYDLLFMAMHWKNICVNICDACTQNTVYACIVYNHKNHNYDRILPL